jgi:hypothetical protein
MVIEVVKFPEKNPKNTPKSYYKENRKLNPESGFFFFFSVEILPESPKTDQKTNTHRSSPVGEETYR